MTNIKRDWERYAPPLSRRLREIQEEDWKKELLDYMAGKQQEFFDLEDDKPDYKWRG